MQAQLVGIRNRSYEKDGLTKQWNTYFFQIEDEEGNMDVVVASTPKNINNKLNTTGTLKMRAGNTKEGKGYIKFESFE